MPVTYDIDLKRIESDRLKYALQLSSLAMLYYDYCLTFTDEVTYIWRSPWRLSTMFYIFCRYSLIANLIYILAISRDVPGISCNTGYLVAGAFSILGHAGIMAVWGLRTVAICEKNKLVSGFLGILASTVLILLIVRTPFHRCSGPVSLPHIRAAISAFMIVFDVMAFILASMHAWRSIQEDSKFWVDPTTSINYVIFSQGILYILPVFILSVTSLVLNFEINVTFSRVLNSVKVPLSGLLTARFLIRLREWEAKRHDTETKNLPNIEFNDDPRGNDEVTSSLPRWNVERRSTSQGSVLDEFGGNIGPTRQDHHLYRAGEERDEVALRRRSAGDLELGPRTPRSPLSKGKQRARLDSGGDSNGEVIAQSARLDVHSPSTFGPLSPNGTPSAVRSRGRMPPSSSSSSR